MALYIPHSIFPFGAAFVCQAGNTWTLLRNTKHRHTAFVAAFLVPLLLTTAASFHQRLFDLEDLKKPEFAPGLKIKCWFNCHLWMRPKKKHCSNEIDPTDAEKPAFQHTHWTFRLVTRGGSIGSSKQAPVKRICTCVGVCVCVSSRTERKIRVSFTSTFDLKARFLGYTGPNSAGGMDICLLWVLCVVMYRSLRRADHSSRGVIPSVVCPLSVNENPRKKRQWTRNRVEAPQESNIKKKIDKNIFRPDKYRRYSSRKLPWATKPQR